MATIGILCIYSTGYSANNSSFFNFSSSHGRQFIWLLVSLLVGTFIVVIDYKFYTSFAYIIYGVVILVLASVLVFGVEINGSKSWFAIGSFQFQPAELAKFATCLALAKTLSNPNINLVKTDGQFKAFTILVIPIFFILLQGDVGSAVVFSSLIFVLHREGLNSGYLIIGFGSIFLSIMALLYNPFVLLFAYAILLSLFFGITERINIPY
ncbi:MAG: rod shape-determining protein RodA [Chitinophagales bacterium]|nr:rod shape-determining protein RodA [Chitinophagales bacterium]